MGRRRETSVASQRSRKERHWLPFHSVKATGGYLRNDTLQQAEIRRGKACGCAARTRTLKDLGEGSRAGERRTVVFAMGNHV